MVLERTGGKLNSQTDEKGKIMLFKCEGKRLVYRVTSMGDVSHGVLP